MELRRVPYKEQRTDHTTNIAWHLPKILIGKSRQAVRGSSGNQCDGH